MGKPYYEFMDELTSDKVYEGLLGHGMFSEKIPPFLTSEEFYKYCLDNEDNISKKQINQYIHYENMRNINIPRILGIPNPFSYYYLCRSVKENWSKIQDYFRSVTSKDKYKISRIHIRKLANKLKIFEMNYKKYPLDTSPNSDIILGKNYLVEADISNCFPSIYTHALSWALVGKEEAKEEQNNKEMWYNSLDFYTRNCTHGETHGLLIGPHVSNLLSEIILAKIDSNLSSNWEYIRNIDDYTCYVKNYEEAQLFIADLSRELKIYGLALNHKKTKISKLPLSYEPLWKHEIQTLLHICKKDMLKYNDLVKYFDVLINIMYENGENSAILNYAIKALSHEKMTKNAESYFYKTIFHLALIYPYLIPLLENYVFNLPSINIQIIQEISKKIYLDNMKSRNYEGATYALYYAVKYKFELEFIDIEEIKQSGDCLLLLTHFLYDKIIQSGKDHKNHNNFAKYLNTKKDDMNRYWLYVYEVLSAGNLTGDWKALKKNGITFIKI